MERTYGTIGRGALVTALGLALGGCYSGFQDYNAGGDAGGPAGASGAGADAGSGDDTADGDGQIEAQCVDAPRQIGATALRRLTQLQYHNTIVDLLGIDDAITDSFSADERIGPFKSNGIAPLGDLEVEQYVDAAEIIAEQYVTVQAGGLSCDAEGLGDRACAERWLRDMMPRAYRRPVEDAEVSRMMEVYDVAADEGGMESGIELMLQTMLQSPLFLYHVEYGQDTASAGPRPLTGYELASRLSYFLWNGMPDQALFDAAASEELQSDEGLAAQVDRMLADPRAQAAVVDFHLQWLGVDEIESLEKDPTFYPDFDSSLARAMKEDVASFVTWVFTEGDGRLETLLTNALTLSDDPALLALYGVERPASATAGTPVALPQTERAGLLTSPAVMAQYAHADQSSPVHRGQFVRENVLCTNLPDPPQDVDDTPPEPQPGSTTRERFQEHTANPECFGCHQLIDGLGFGFEHYDGSGAFRTTDQDRPVNASGEIIQTDVDGPYDGGIELSQRLASSPQVSACIAAQWFRYSLGRLNDSDDKCALQQLAARFTGSEEDVSVLIHEVVASDAFRYRRLDDEPSTITE